MLINMKRITNELIQKFKTHLINEEKSSATLEKYIRDVVAFMQWLNDRVVEKIVVMEYKQNLIENYAPASVNSMLSSINSFFVYNEWYELMVKAIKIQKQIFANKETRERNADPLPGRYRLLATSNTVSYLKSSILNKKTSPLALSIL